MGFLLFLREGSLLAQPFDGVSKLTGDVIPIAEDVGSVGTYGWMSVSNTRVLAYRTGRGAELTWAVALGTLVIYAMGNRVGSWSIGGSTMRAVAMSGYGTARHETALSADCAGQKQKQTRQCVQENGDNGPNKVQERSHCTILLSGSPVSIYTNRRIYCGGQGSPPK